MTADRVERRLAAILAADVAGYSRLMGADEEGTLARLTAHRRELFDPAIAKHRGRIVKTTGDGLLAEFASVVDAVRCAAEVQAGMAERNAAGATGGPRIDFRIGINVGDIVMQDDDIFGDGVNIAARLEGIAGAYRLRVEGVAAAGPAAPKEFRALPDRPSLAVLPFQNMSGDPEQDYFADGIVEDIITGLSRFRSFAVVSRNSSFVYKGKAVDVRQAAKELGVRYVLEGSVRRSGERLRITAQLIEASAGAHLWADRFDGTVEDIFDVQDRITESVVGVIEPQIRRAEIERSRTKRPENLDAYDLNLRAVSKIYTSLPEDNAEAFALMMQAIALEPNYAPLLANAVWALQYRTIAGWPALTGDDRAACLDLVRRALVNAHGDPAVLAQCGIALVDIGRDYERGMQIVANAVAANPNNQFVLMVAATVELHCGSLDDSLAQSRRAILMSPGDPTAYWPMTAIAHAHMALGAYEEALKAAERSLAVNPDYAPTCWILIAANAQLGRMDEARSWLGKFRTLHPGITIARIKAGQPDKYPDRTAAIFEGLRLAGLEEG